MTNELAQGRYFNRELSWLEFNARVLAEAMDPTNLLFDRLKFIGIVSSNLDEFFMVRVASVEATAAEEIIRQRAYALMDQQGKYFSDVLAPELEKANIQRVPSQVLTEQQLEFLKSFFSRELFPVLTPIALYEDKPTPPLVNLSLYLVFELVPFSLQETSASEMRKQYAVVEVPKNFPRMISLPAEKGYQFMLIEDVITLFAKELFLGQQIMNRGLLRITRAAEMTLDEESDEDFSKIVMEALRTRRQSNMVRVEAALSPGMNDFLRQKLSVSPDKFYRNQSWFDLKSISQLAYQPLFQELKRPAWQPRPVPAFEREDDWWAVLKEKDVWIHHPYESFNAVLDFIAAAAVDPDVLAIKQTLYRVGSDSAVVNFLEKAAENGKRVTVLVELKARFEEENNISWARRLENAGAAVIYGIRGLKTHAKVCLVVRREPEGIKRYLHLSTGNYNDKTAQIYSDIGYFTSDEGLAHDATTFFNAVTGFSQPVNLSKITMAPYMLRRKLRHLVQREIVRSSPEKPGLILAKMNSLVDLEMIDALYKASQAGVKIKLLVRGICCLKPGVPGLSENIEVQSMVDIFLEHSRIFYFYNGGDEQIFLSSADWMPRNFDRRVEIMFPVENAQTKRELVELLQLYFKDNAKSWQLLADGRYEKIERPHEKKFRVQEYLCQRVVEREQQKTKVLPYDLKPQKSRAKEKILES